MRIKLHPARDGVIAQWLVTGDTLHVYLNDELDEVARQRYITQAKIETGFTDGPGRAVPLVLPAPVARIRDAASHHPIIAASVVVAAAAGVAAAVIMPAALDDNSNSITQRPSAAGPPNSRPRTPSHVKPTKPRHTPAPVDSTPQTAPAETSLPGPVDDLTKSVTGRKLPVRLPPIKIPPISAPPVQPPHPRGKVINVKLPPVVRASAWLSPSPKVRIRLGAPQP